MTKHFCDMCGKDCGESYKDITVIRIEHIEPYEPLRSVDDRYDICEECAKKVNNFIKRKGLDT